MNAQPLQRTEEWFAHRRGRITASRVGAILGVSKYRTPDDVMRDMVRDWHGAEPEFEGNDATQWGQDHEADAIAAYEAATGEMVDPAPLVVHPAYDWLAASPDGYVGPHCLIECKAPYRAKYTEASDEYRQQMQLQMACTGRYTCDFVIWRQDEDIIIKRYQYDAGAFADNLDTLRSFMDRFREVVGNKDLSAPYLEPMERKDSVWRMAAQRYTQAKHAAELAAQAEKEAKDALIELAPAGAKGCGVNVIKSERAGSIGYAKALKAIAPDADLEPYRGKPSTIYSVRVDS